MNYNERERQRCLLTDTEYFLFINNTGFINNEV